MCPNLHSTSTSTSTSNSISFNHTARLLPQVESRGFPLRKNCLEKHCGHAGATIKCPYGQTRFIYPMLCFTCMICCYDIFCIHATNNGVLHYCIMHGWMNVKYVYTLQLTELFFPFFLQICSFIQLTIMSFKPVFVPSFQLSSLFVEHVFIQMQFKLFL